MAQSIPSCRGSRKTVSRSLHFRETASRRCLNVDAKREAQAAFTRTRFHLKRPRFRYGYTFCLHDTDRDCYRNCVDLKPVPRVERFQNDAVSSVVQTEKKASICIRLLFWREICIGEFST